MVTLLAAFPAVAQFISSTPLPESYYGHGLVASGSFLYNVGGLGGINGVGVAQKVFYAPILSTGGVGSWTETSPLPEAVFFHSVVISNGFIYVLGGYHYVAEIAVSNVVYFSRINSDGSLDTWQTTSPLPEAVFFLSAAVANGAIYEMGGWNGQALTAAVYSANIQPDGTLGSWLPQTALPTGVYTHVTVTDGQTLYVTGGVTSGGNVVTDTVYYSKINPDKTLASWSPTTPLPQVVSNHAAALQGGRIYLTGGWNGSTPVTTAVSANVNADGTVGNWSAFGTLPDALYLHAEAVTDRFLFVDGGTDGNNPQAAVYFMGLDNDSDGVPDYLDNCINVPNPDQRDTNADGYGNLCDPDFNGDGTININDFNRLKARLGVSPVVDVDTDLDGNGAVNINDLNRLKSYLGKSPGPSGLHPNCPPTCP